MKILIPFNNYCLPNLKNKLFPDWGFSALLEIDKRLLLFDTGSNGQILLRNLKSLNVKINKIFKVVISHNHWDHTGGLVDIARLNPHLEIIAPELDEPLVNKLLQYDVTVNFVKRSIKIEDNLITTPVFKGKIPELGLVIKTAMGNILLTGCAHPGIKNMLKKVPAPRLAVIGGFHLFLKKLDEIIKIAKDIEILDVRYLCPSHCTGEYPIEFFKRYFKDHYLYGGLGATFNF